MPAKKEEKSLKNIYISVICSILFTILIVVGVILFTKCHKNNKEKPLEPIDYTSQRNGLLDILNKNIKETSILPDESAHTLITFEYIDTEFTLVGVNDDTIYVLSLDLSDVDYIEYPIEAFNYVSELTTTDMTSVINRLDIKDDDPYIKNTLLKDREYKYVSSDTRTYFSSLKGEEVSYVCGNLTEEVNKPDYKLTTINGREDIELYSAYRALIVE